MQAIKAINSGDTVKLKIIAQQRTEQSHGLPSPMMAFREWRQRVDLFKKTRNIKFELNKKGKKFFSP